MEYFTIEPLDMVDWYDYEGYFQQAGGSGTTVSFDFGKYNRNTVVSFTGLGMPEIDWLTNKTPYSHGVYATDYRMKERKINMTITTAGCSREDYWNLRAELIEALRPRTRIGAESGTTATLWHGLQATDEGELVPNRLSLYLPDGRVRCIDVFYSDGALFNPRNLDEWNEWGYEETIELWAPDPTFYDPNWKEEQRVPNATLYFDYFGTAESYPVIEIQNISSGAGHTGVLIQNAFPKSQFVQLSDVTTPLSINNKWVVNTKPGQKSAFRCNSLGELQDYSEDITGNLSYIGTGIAKFSFGPYGSRQQPTEAHEVNTVGHAPYDSGLLYVFKYYERYIGV